MLYYPFFLNTALQINKKYIRRATVYLIHYRSILYFFRINTIPCHFQFRLIFFTIIPKIFDIFFTVRYYVNNPVLFPEIFKHHSKTFAAYNHSACFEHINLIICKQCFLTWQKKFCLIYYLMIFVIFCRMVYHIRRGK